MPRFLVIEAGRAIAQRLIGLCGELNAQYIFRRIVLCVEDGLVGIRGGVSYRDGKPIFEAMTADQGSYSGSSIAVHRNHAAE